jgi:hypothetical protein
VEKVWQHKIRNEVMAKEDSFLGRRALILKKLLIGDSFILDWHVAIRLY